VRGHKNKKEESMGFKRNKETGALEINITGDPVIDNLSNRKDDIADGIKALAYERLQLTRRVEEIDKSLGQLEGAQVANDLVQKDIDLRETIALAQKEAADKKAADQKAAEAAVKAQEKS
jgi:hypothetical protein